MPVQSPFRSHPARNGMGGRDVSREKDQTSADLEGRSASNYLTALELSDVACDHYCNCTPLSQSNSSRKSSQKAKSSGKQPRSLYGDSWMLQDAASHPQEVGRKRSSWPRAGKVENLVFETRRSLWRLEPKFIV